MQVKLFLPLRRVRICILSSMVSSGSSMLKYTHAPGAVVSSWGSSDTGSVGRTMREHCGEMAAHCKQMAEQFGGRGESVGRT